MLPNTTDLITSELGYMIFARGHRGIIVSNQYANAAPTTLRAKGEINVGNISRTLDPDTFKVIDNPYPSAINFNKVTVNGFSPQTTAGISFYLWDPKFAGNSNVGGWVACTSKGDGFYWVTANGSGYVNGTFDGTIESGAAFLMPASPGSISFTENCKVTTSSTKGIASRPIGVTAPSDKMDYFATNLLSGSDASATEVDGVINAGSHDFDNAVNERDAPKLISFQTKEKISILREGKKLSIELRKKITADDTIFYHLSKLNLGTYQFVFIRKSVNSLLTAVLEDKFTRQSIVMPLTDTVAVPFNITNESASADPERFRVVFKKSANFNHIEATVIGSDIKVEWKLNNELNTRLYEIERSLDGINFSVIGSTNSLGNNLRSTAYNWLDENLNAGLYFYRVKSTSKIEEISYSDIVKARIVRSLPSMYILSNPITDNNIQLRINQAVLGVYRVRLLNAAGQPLLQQTVAHSGSNATHTIQPEHQLPAGTYQLQVINPAGKKQVLSIVVQ